MAEAVIWNELKAGSLGGYKFVRQMPIGPYFADFACRSRKLIIELDGSQHAVSERDRRRDACLTAKGYSVLRFWCHETLKHTGAVCNTILAALEGRLSEPILASDVRFIPAAAKARK